MIFKKVGDSRPYPQHGMTHADWGGIPPRQVRLDTLITTQKTLNLETLLAEDSTFYGDLFPHVVKWGGELYLEDGVHRARCESLVRGPRQSSYAGTRCTAPQYLPDHQNKLDFSSHHFLLQRPGLHLELLQG